MAEQNTITSVPSSATSNTIFNDGVVKKQGFNYITGLDYGIMTTQEEKSFNTYRHFEPFALPMQNVLKDSKSKDKDGNPEMTTTSTYGTKSLFNNFNAVVLSDEYRTNANMPVLDNPESRKNQRKNTACTIKDLVDASEQGLMGRQMYSYSDFAYCKYLGKISNNYLITLRRFGSPCGDRIDKRTYPSIRVLDESIQQHQPDIGRLVTWLGTPNNELSKILTYTYKMQWEDVEAKFEDIEDESVEGQGPLASLFNMSNANYRKLVQKGYAGSNLAGGKYIDQMFGGNAFAVGTPPYKLSDWNKEYDQTKVYGPVDVIDKTKKRKRGLVFEQSFDLTFDYEMRSYYGVNGKAAMIDLLGNILATTYTHGTFWGGERRFIGGAQDNVFANLPIFKLADQGGLNNFPAVIDSLIESVQQGAKAFTGNLKGETTKEKIKNALSDIGGMLLGGALNKLGRPQKHALSSLVSPAPVGCWHLTIGNPKSPILEIGNLVCTEASVEHYGPLGLDDFPTGIRVKVKLEHAKPRDIVGIEQMYGRGDTRVYSPLGGKIIDMYKNSKKITYNKNDTNNKKLDIKNELSKIGYTVESIEKEVNKKIVSTTNNISDIDSLQRYYGIKDQNIIVAAAGESLYGSITNKKKA